jgi:two-component system cell cycle sensor histidine kinase/response regulator CckA
MAKGVKEKELMGVCGVACVVALGLLAVAGAARAEWSSTSLALLVVVMAPLLSLASHRLIRRDGKYFGKGKRAGSEFEERLLAAADEFSFGIVLYDYDLKITFANRYALRVYDKSLEEVVGRKDSDLLSEESVAMFASELREAGIGGLPGSVETRLGDSSRRRMFLMTFAPLLQSSDGGNRILSIWFEVSRVDEMSERLARLNRTLSTLTDANRIVATSQTVEELQSLFCKNLHERGGYTIAWLGRRESDGTIKASAAAGCDLEDLAPLKLRWDSVGEDAAPVARAISSGKPAGHHRLPEDSKNDPGSGFYEKYKLRACGALPVEVDGVVLYGLCLCSSTGESFDEDEMELLGELARDLGYGISAVLARGRLRVEEQAVSRMLAFNQAGPELEESEIVTRALELALEITESEMGAFYVSEGEEGVKPWFSNSATNTTLQELADSCFQTGRPVYESRSAANAASLHFAAVPVSEPVTALLAVGRKSVGYGPFEAHLLHLVVDNLWRTVQQRRAKQLLTRNQALLAQAQSIAHLGTWSCDLASGEIAWSEELYNIHDLPVGTPITLETIGNLVHWDDFERVRHFATELKTGGDGAVEIEYRVITQTGKTKHVLANALPAVGGNRNILQGTLQDITSQKREEEKRRSFEGMLVRFLDNLPAVITLKNERLEHVYGNAAALQVFQVSADEFSGSTDSTFLRPDATERLHVAERSALATRQLVHAPDITVGDGPVGRRLRGVCFPVTLPDGEVLVGMYAIDVTELESATAKSVLLQTALESAANGVVITDVKGRIEWVNTAFTRITGYDAAEAVGEHSRLLKSGRHDQAFYRNMWATLLRGDVWNGEIKNRRKDGTIYDEQMTITPVRSMDGRIAHFIAIKLDVSERHEMEEKILRSQRMESIGLLAGGVAHDLNNILAPIMMGVELLKSTELDRSSANELLDGLLTNCERGAGIIRQVLTFARGVEGERVIVQLRHQVKDIVKMARETFPKNIDVSMDIPGNFWPVVGDPTQLHQILLNFSVNARDAMPHGGHLSFVGENVTLQKSRSFQAFEIPPGRYAKVSVTDTGSGIPPEILERIFEPFFTTKAQGKGTGLGLPTVLGIAKSHGGLIEMVSTLGHGTSAVVWLPATESSTEAPMKQDLMPPQGHGETILVVDDEESVRKTICTILTLNKYHVLEAVDGAEAVGIFATNANQIRLVLTDVMMPVMDGVALAHALRRIAPNLVIVGSSGFFGEDEGSDRFERFRAAGVRTVLQKPYTANELLETIAAELSPNS